MFHSLRPRRLCITSHANADGRYLVATTTVWSGLSYVFSKDAVRILSDNKKDKAKQDKNDETKQP